MEKLRIAEFLERCHSIPVLDVRSPAEYQAGHIPGANSFPLFDNEERASVGTLYKQEGRKAAVKKGLEIVGPKMCQFVEEADSLDAPMVGLYCWRGGMRSESMAWLLERFGMETAVLKNGYKAYRNHLLRFFEQDLPLKVITGFTGSRKTSLLHLLAERGEQVVDLEGLANHQGSRFGNEKSTGQPTAEHFQNLLFEAFRNLNLDRGIWIEDESKRIGRATLPDNLYRLKNKCPHILINVEKEQRAEFLVDEYGRLTRNQLVAATSAISKKLGKEKTAAAIDHIEKGQLKAAAMIILDYYDKRYQKSISKKEHLIVARFNIDMKDLPVLAEKLTEISTYERKPALATK